MGDGPCCGFTRKTVVMAILSLACCLLVLWTIIVTAVPAPVPEVKVIVKANTTYPSLLAVCPLNSSLPLERISLSLTKEHPSIEPMTKQVNIGTKRTHCKCLCEINATEDELVEALQIAKRKRLEKNAAAAVQNKT
eukprot:GFUD01036950.1.p1 GENE.GFUD01036950.1~~GFUD01036950.1.p1  ORF type:complete len:136 (+),score=24.31 GFUD01036950.1:44-451(+)